MAEAAEVDKRATALPSSSNGLASASPAGAVSLSLGSLTALAPHAQQKLEILSALNKHAAAYRLDTPLRLAMLLAQVGHESGGFTRWSENLNYSAARLYEIFPRQFPTSALANHYSALGPEAIANRVYANRLGNGDERSGDGWAFRGRGPIQLTGRANYARFGRIVGMDLEMHPEAAAEIDLGVEIACAYFVHAACVPYADRGDVAGCTRVINGGVHGLLDRVKRYEHACRVLGVAA